MVNKKHCKLCDQEGHTAFYCPTKARKPLKTTKKLKLYGKYQEKWRGIKKKWYKKNPPDHQGFYYCYICGVAMTKSQTTLDHVESRARRRSYGLN